MLSRINSFHDIPSNPCTLIFGVLSIVRLVQCHASLVVFANNLNMAEDNYEHINTSNQLYAAMNFEQGAPMHNYHVFHYTIMIHATLPV